MGKYFHKTLIFLAFLTMGFKAGAQVVINDNTRRALIGKNVDVLQPTKELGLNEAIKSADFKK
ncbi:MAG TPA: hypothetical protein VNW51_09050, partial [Mucilaginibacter sp.]|nr:hypothetical protein [Mucilaginibacter sp.]